MCHTAMSDIELCQGADGDATIGQLSAFVSFGNLSKYHSKWSAVWSRAEQGVGVWVSDEQEPSALITGKLEHYVSPGPNISAREMLNNSS